LQESFFKRGLSFDAYLNIYAEKIAFFFCYKEKCGKNYSMAAAWILPATA